MAPLAGKPPFATDEPDSYYETPRAPQPRLRQPNPNDRTSAYNVYDNYLGDAPSKLAAPADGAGGASRNSGIGAMLLNMDDDSDDDSDDESYRRPAAPPGITPGPGTPLSKNAALAAATGASVPSTPTTPTRPSPPPFQQQQQHQQQRSNNPFNQPPPPQPINLPQPQMQQQMHQQPIAAPRPGYPAPIAALNLARPEPSQPPISMRVPPAPIQIPTGPFNPNNNIFGGGAMPASPAPSSPHPLLPPVTPITPAFIRPTNSSVVNVSFAGVNTEGEGKAVPRKPIIRGNSEETLLPGRGEKGDDFWRRFSMVVKEENKKGSAKESSWLKKTRSGAQSYSRWVWILGICLILLIIGGVGIGVYLTRNSPSHQQPKAIGGSADNVDDGSGVSTAAANGAAAGGGGGAGGKTTSSPHVSPTHTIAGRAMAVAAVTGVEGPVVTPFLTPVQVPRQVVRRHQQLKNRDAGVW